MRRKGNRHHNKKNKGASEATNRGNVPSANATEKSCQRLGKGEVLPLDRSLLMGDFSVVQFRLDFVLFSEQDYMKTLKNQWLLTMPSPPAIPCGGTNQGTHHGVGRADTFAVT